MRLRRVLTEHGPQVEALKTSAPEQWVRLSNINSLNDIQEQFSKNNLTTSTLAVLELGNEGNHLNFITTGEEIFKPSYTQALDYELELGAILAKPLLNASPAEAEKAIGGYVVLNDISARDVQLAEMKSGFGPQKAKHFLNAMSHIVVTADEISDRINQLQGSIIIDGMKCAACSTSNMQYSLGEAIAYASRNEQLHVGELFGSGTLPGGSGMENDHWVHSGNLLTLEIDDIAKLTNKII